MVFIKFGYYACILAIIYTLINDVIQQKKLQRQEELHEYMQEEENIGDNINDTNS